MFRKLLELEIFKSELQTHGVKDIIRGYKTKIHKSFAYTAAGVPHPSGLSQADAYL